MGNNISITDVNYEINKLDCINNYNIDAEVIFINKVKSPFTNVMECNNLIGLKHDIFSESVHDTDMIKKSLLKSTHQSVNKKYIIRLKINGITRIFLLLIKILENNIFIYVTDLNNVTPTEKLIYVTKIDNDDNKIKYIQISNDFKFISLPENDSITVYNLMNLLLQNELQCVGTISDVKNIYQPYKCILCDNFFIVIYKEDDNYKNIIGFDYNNNLIYEIKNLNSNINKSILKFSANGRFIFIHNSIKTTTLLYDMNDDSNCKSIDLNIKNDTILDSICISDDGTLIFYIENKTFNIYNIMDNNIYNFNSMEITDYNFYLLDYSEFSYIDILSRVNSTKFYDKLYVLVGWDRKLKTSFYQIIRFSDNTDHGCITYEPCSIGIKVNGKIDYVYFNNHMIIYKTLTNNDLIPHDDIIIHDINVVVPIKFAGLIASEARNSLMKLYKSTYSHERDKYYRNIEIIGADDSKILYELDDFMTFFLAIPKTTQNVTNIFQLRVNANIDISPIDIRKDVNVFKNPNMSKSFNIFKNLMNGKINQTEIISNLFTIKGTVGRHNMMCELMSHMYEYARIIALKNVSDEETKRTIYDESNETLNKDKQKINIVNKDILFNNIKALYIGYILIVLVLKYYVMLFKSDRQLKIHSKKDQLFNIINIFNQNFPAFEEFMLKTLQLIIGEIDTNYII